MENKEKNMEAQARRILFPLAGAALGMLAGAGFGMDKGIAASAAFFGFVGFGLGYALHDFNWKRNRKTALTLLLAFLAPIIGFAWLMAPQVFGLAGIMPASLAQVAAIALTVGPAIGGLLALVVYAAANTFGLIDDARGWPADGAMEEDEIYPNGISSVGGPYGYGYSINGFPMHDDD
jgi:hypothetical protein